MGKGLIPADGEIWRIRRRAIVPALHQKVLYLIYGSNVLTKKIDLLLYFMLSETTLL